MLENLSAENFSGCMQQTFKLHVGEGQVWDAELVDVTTLGSGAPGKRAPFSLIFRCPGDMPAAQGIFRVEHESLGALDIFLVPIGRDDAGLRFEAIFS